MRISIITGYFLPVPPVSGGATERSWFGLAKAFASEGHKVTFVSRTWPGLPRTETSEGVDHIRVDGSDHTRHLVANIVLDFLWGVRVAQVLPDADVVICNTITAPAWLNLFYPRAGKVVVMIGRTPKGQVPFYRGVARIYAPSTDLASKIRQPWAFSRTKVIGYPIEWGRHARASAQVSPPLTIGYAGRVHPEKGIALLFRAACLLSQRSDLPQWRLRLVGPVSVREGGGGEDWFSELRRDSAALLGDRVEWDGPEYDTQRLAEHYGRMDIFCYPSLAEKGETFGVSVAEAMAADCAVVVSALGCFRDLVDDGETGLVFDHRSNNPENALYECLVRLLLDGEVRRKLAAKGQLKARSFDNPEVSKMITDDLALLARTAAMNSH